jgi:YidC/Oxa1 family membrane protein insertase
MDRKTLIAVAACVLLLLAYPMVVRWAGYGRYLEHQTPNPPPTAVDSTRVAGDSARANPSGVAATTPSGGATSGAKSGALPGAPPPEAELRDAPFHGTGAVLERSYEIDTPLYRAEFSSRGARLLSVELKRFASARGISSLEHKRLKLKRGDEVPAGDRVSLAGGPLVALDLGSGAALRSLANVGYAVEESTDAAGAVHTLIFTAKDAGLMVRQVWRARPDDYALDYQVEISGVPEAWRISDYSITLRSWPLVTENNLESDLHSLRVSSMLGSDLHKDHAPNLLKNPKSYDGNVQWAAVQNRYFIAAAAVIDGAPRGVTGRAEKFTLPDDLARTLPPGAKPEQELAINTVRMALAGQTRHRFVAFFGPVEYFRLSALKVHLERAVDLGWTWVLPFSTALLKLLNWLYALVGNYGVAIILLATLVRVVLHPLNMASMKSQLKLQKLQPEIARLREKYKNDAQSMNTATMALYKENKVNPAGGCLPMLVQMPLFLALYQVLFNAIELRQAPFMAWMTDLSAPDLLTTVAGFPIRLLPVVMGATGFLSQMLTPMDPSQKPTMYLMNAFMLVFFYNLPSGLVLYWTVMNVLTAIQQWLVLRGHPAEAAQAVEVVVPATGKRRSRAR